MHDFDLTQKVIGAPDPYNPKRPGNGIGRRMALWLRWARVAAVHCPSPVCKRWLSCIKPALECEQAQEGDRWDWDWGWRGCRRTDKYGVKGNDWSRVSRRGTEDLIECERIAQASGWRPPFAEYFGLPGPYLYIDNGFEQGTDGEVEVGVVRPVPRRPDYPVDWNGRRIALYLRFARANGENCPDRLCRREGICQRPPLACRLRRCADRFDWNTGWNRRVERQRREFLEAEGATPDGSAVLPEGRLDTHLATDGP